MCFRRRQHGSDEFGRTSGRTAIGGFDPPMIGAGASITLDGIVERESGETPPPPPFSMRTAVIGLVVLFALGVVILTVATCMAPAPPV